MRLTFIEDTLTRASSRAMGFFSTVTSTVTSTVKDGDANQVVTEADFAVGRDIIDRIRTVFPEDSILDEETGFHRGTSDNIWVVDPIDGTSNFAAGSPMFGVMLGLLRGSVPVAGGVILPALGELYLAERDGGATCNGRTITVTEEEDLLSVLVAYGIDGNRDDPEQTHEEMRLLAGIALNCRNIRTTNSAVDQMMVARGAYGASLNQTSRIWDNVAPAIIIEEAGGVYTDFYGAPVRFHVQQSSMTDRYTWCAASPVLHKRVQALLGRS